MNTKDRDIFYKAAGNLVRNKREATGYTYAQLAKIVDEQNITIRNIEEGSRFSAHHLLWMRETLGITFDNILEQAQEIYGGNSGEEIKRIEDFI